MAYLKYEPFIKRSSNRENLLPYLMNYVPETFNQYCEPFVGNGELLFALHPNEALINDQNYELINAYKMVQKNPQGVNDLVSQYLKENSRSFFNRLRDTDRKKYFQNWTNLKLAARYIYLNQASLSGKWITNWNDHCKIAYNRKSKITFNTNMLYQDAEYLQNHVKIMAGMYQTATDQLQSNDFVYLNPPYIPISAFTLFKSTITNQFNMASQRQLAKIAKELVHRGVYVMISNADVPMLHELYQAPEFEIHSIQSVPVIESNDRLLPDVNEAIIVGNHK